MRGTVYLIGAGPGDPGLVSRRALELLRQADVIVYDRLSAPELLAEARPGCELVDAGKTAGDHTLPQSATNELLVQKAREGKLVARLKGGDPFLFGRGGEEAAFCRNARVPFEVVPGITSAIAVPAYAGIPVTHRGVAHHVTIVTASAGADGSDDPDYEWLARSEGTLVLLMGLRRIGHISTALIGEGAPPNRPVAVISRGTTSEQRTVVADLGTIAARVEEADLKSPAIIVVGDVVSLRDTVGWFEQRPLFGSTITVTRARAQASELVRSLESLGAEVVECPMIRVEPTNPDLLAAELAAISRRDFILFTSINGAELFFEGLRAQGLDARTLHRAKVGVVGEGCADVCRRFGIEPDIMPPKGKRTGAGLLDALGDEPIYSASILLVRAMEGDEQLPEGLRERGARLDVLPIYRNVVDVPDAAAIKAAIRSDFVTFTAASTVRNFARLIPEGEQLPPAITIGPVTSEAAVEHGFEVVREAQEPSVGGIIVALLEQVLDHAGVVPATSSQES